MRMVWSGPFVHAPAGSPPAPPPGPPMPPPSPPAADVVVELEEPEEEVFESSEQAIRAKAAIKRNACFIGKIFTGYYPFWEREGLRLPRVRAARRGPRHDASRGNNDSTGL